MWILRTERVFKMDQDSEFDNFRLFGFFVFRAKIAQIWIWVMKLDKLDSVGQIDSRLIRFELPSCDQTLWSVFVELACH